MYNPCQECMFRYDRLYSDWCDENCLYGQSTKRLREYMLKIGQYHVMIQDINQQIDNVIAQVTKED